MKKSISLFLALSMIVMASVLMTPEPASAQASLKSTTSGNTLDTVTNTGVRIMATKVTGYRETITAAITITKISGTQGGTMVPVGSNDGITFVDISQATKDTVSVPNVATYSKGYSFQKGWQWYGVQWTGTGSMSGSISGILLARKPSE